jgi:cysteinyl-tRNA synthetase
VRLYNTLSRQVEPLKPLSKGQVKMYTCGPTVYHYMHIGNLRKAIFDDLLKRTLLAEGLKVRHIMNITDVGHLVSDGDAGEDKLEKEARIEKKSVWDIAEYYTQHALADYDSVNALKPDKTIKATDCIDAEIDFIRELEKKGFAYIGDLAVYFDTSKLKDYGKLSGQNLSEKETAVREDIVVDKSKKNPSDFALWIFTRGKHEDHAMRWESPWGEGFPGWHVECSTIIKKELGESIDIHTGGVDHIGTHHTNEIAQSEALTGKPLSNIWMHTEFLSVEGEKMSKSLGNIYRIVDLEDRGFDRLAYRLLVIQSHYRTQQNFTWQALKGAESRLKSLQAAADLRFQPQPEKTAHDFDQAQKVILGSLLDDLNSPESIAKVNNFLDQIVSQGVDTSDSRKLTNFIKWLDDLLGLELSKSQDISPSQKKFINAREKARNNQDWAKSDQLRDELSKQGIGVRDTEKGPVWQKA